MNSSVLRNLESSPHETDGSNAVQPGGRMKGHAPSVGKAWQAISRGKIKRSVALDTVADSNTTGSMAARLICHLKSAISNQAERGTSACRFVDELPAEDLAALWNRLHSDGFVGGGAPPAVGTGALEKPATYADKPNQRTFRLRRRH